MKIFNYLFFLFSVIHLPIQGQKILPRFWNYDKGQKKDEIYAENPTINVDGMRNVDIEVQSIEISTYSALPGMDGITLHFMVYPNPFKEFLILKIEGDNPTKYIATIYDMNGKGLITERVVGDETTFLTNRLIPAVYMLKVMQMDGNSAQRIHKVFKVVKK